MAYGIISAQYANSHNTAVVAQTSSAGAVAISQERAVLWAELQEWISAGGVIQPYAPPATADPADMDNAAKILKAVCIYFGQQVGKTPAQVKAGIKSVYDALP